RRLAGSPGDDLALAALLGLKAFADQGGDDVRGLQIEVVPRAEEIDEQQVDAVATEFAVISAHLLDQQLLGQAIRGIGLLRIAIPQVALFERNRREFRIRADGADDDHLLDAELPARLN